MPQRLSGNRKQTEFGLKLSSLVAGMGLAVLPATWDSKGVLESAVPDCAVSAAGHAAWEAGTPASVLDCLGSPGLNQHRGAQWQLMVMALCSGQDTGPRKKGAFQFNKSLLSSQ